MGAAGAAIGMIGVGAGVNALSSYETGRASSNYYNYLSSTAELNAGLSKAEGTSKRLEAGAQENQEQIQLTNKISSVIGSEKAAIVNGVGGSSRSAQDIIGDTVYKGNLDEAALRVNSELVARNATIGALSGAMNYGAQASGYSLSAGNARAAGDMGVATSLLGGASSVASSYYMGQMYSSRGYGGQGNIGSVN